MGPADQMRPQAAKNPWSFAREPASGGGMRRARSSLPSLLVALATTVSAGFGFGLGSGGCVNADGRPPPEDEPAFPTGLALDPKGDRLVVVSSNFNLAYQSGAVLLADLARAREQLGEQDAVVDDAYVAAVPLPSFGDTPVVDRSAGHVFVATRGGNLLHEITLGSDGLSCGRAGCDEPPHALQLAGNDPFVLVLLDQVLDSAGALVSARALVTHSSSPTAEFVRFDTSAADAERLRLEPESLFFGDDVYGVRSAVFLPATNETPDRIVALFERRVAGSLAGADLAVIDVPAVNQGDEAVIARTDVTALTGALTGRDTVALVPHGGDGTLSVVVALRSPDALARFSFDEARKTFALTHLDSTCRRPTGLAAVDVDVDGVAATPGVSRILVTCQDGQAVLALDPLDLAVTDAVRFYGRGPYDVVVDEVHQLAYVSFFLDSSIGVLSLVSDGEARLTPVGRLGTPLPPPEDGRE
jgi:hypothetical protein